jgi:hypothetical protein
MAEKSKLEEVIAMKTLKFLVVFLVLVGLIGCGSSAKYLPRHALTDPVEGISVPHPVEIEKAGIKTITTFIAIMDPGLWTEIVAGGGIWPALAQAPNGEILKGYGYLSGINYWGDFLLQFVFCYSREDLVQAKILYFNRDAGWAYQLIGQEVKVAGQAEKSLTYNPKKFDDDEEYQTELFTKLGMTLSEMDAFWIDYLKEKGINASPDLSSIRELIVGSKKWQQYKKKLAIQMRYNYKMGNSQIRTGYLPLENFRQLAVEMPGFSNGERYLERAKLPLIALPFTGAGMLIVAAASVASDAVVAGIDDNWTGFYGRATILRHQMAPLFRQICRVYKELLVKRDEKIRTLERSLEFRLIFNNSQIGKRR